MRITAIDTVQCAAWPHLIWTRVHTDAGLVGLGETCFHADAVAGYVHGVAAPHLLGKDPLRIDLHSRTLLKSLMALVAFQGSGCAISKASASLMTEAVKGKTVDEARALFDQFHQMITSPPGSPLPELGKLSVLSGVRDFPTRVKCAGLAWHALKAAVAETPSTPVSTE